jgi:hypothetical protein
LKGHFAFLLTLLLSIGWTFAQQTEPIVVAGEIANGTAGGAIPPDLPVTLHVFSAVEEMGVYTTTASADGSFRFDQVAVVEKATLIARVAYEDVAYFSDPATLEPGLQELSLPGVSIYETTEDPADVQVTQLHVFASVAGDRLRVSEFHLLGNSGDRTYVGARDPESGERVSLTFSLPEGATNLSFDGPGIGERFLAREGGFADTQPVLPGAATSEVFFNYELPYRGGMQVERTFGLPVASVALVTPDEGIALEGSGLTSAGAVDTQMGPALAYTAGPLTAGESLAFAVVERPSDGVVPAASGPVPTRNTTGEVAIGILTLGLAGATAYLLWRSPTLGEPTPDVRPLIRSIAALDVDFESGRVEEQAYRQKRKALKQRLRAMLSEQADD